MRLAFSTVTRRAIVLTTIWLASTSAVNADKPDWCGLWTWGGGGSTSRTNRPWFKGTFVATSWARLEPEHGRFDWSVLDQPMQTAADHGLYVAWELRYDAAANPRKTAFRVQKTNTGRWLEKSVQIDDGHFGNRCPRKTDLMLVNTDTEDDIFHMIELTRDRGDRKGFWGDGRGR